MSDAPAPARRQAGRFVVPVALACLVVAVCGGLWILLRVRPDLLGGGGRPPVLASEAETAVRTALTVSVDKPVSRCFADVARLGGTVVPREEIEIRPDSEGLKVVRIMAEPLAEVAAGQVLAQLTPIDGRTTVIPVRAPVAGTIGRSTILLGSLTSGQAPPLFHLVAGGDLELAAEVPSGLVARLSPGLAVTVTPLGGEPVVGRVRSVAKSVDPKTQLGLARVALPAGTGIRWGTFARGAVSLAERCGLGVPASALMRGPDATVVYLATNAVVEARPVTTGLHAGDLVEVTGGLAAGDRVVQQAGPFLREGDPVRTVEARKAVR